MKVIEMEIQKGMEKKLSDGTVVKISDNYSVGESDNVRRSDEVVIGKKLTVIYKNKCLLQIEISLLDSDDKAISDSSKSKRIDTVWKFIDKVLKDGEFIMN